MQIKREDVDLADSLTLSSTFGLPFSPFITTIPQQVTLRESPVVRQLILQLLRDTLRQFPLFSVVL